MLTLTGGLGVGIPRRPRVVVKTVNGGIGLTNTEVTGSLVTSNGDITLEGGSRVNGNLVVRGAKGKEPKPPTITVSGTSVVHGDIEIHDNDRDVRLVLINGGRVTGSTGSAVVVRLDEQPRETSEQR